mmetsp:Transcript_6521/g.15068  ORF Transcript_6521/g.15068 Transcript_6521/m.15068 type:complete len:289 (-) Transcript_6521:1071-1937(-)
MPNTHVFSVQVRCEGARTDSRAVHVPKAKPALAGVVHSAHATVGADVVVASRTLKCTVRPTVPRLTNTRAISLTLTVKGARVEGSSRALDVAVLAGEAEVARAYTFDAHPHVRAGVARVARARYGAVAARPADVTLALPVFEAASLTSTLIGGSALTLNIALGTAVARIAYTVRRPADVSNDALAVKVASFAEDTRTHLITQNTQVAVVADTVAILTTLPMTGARLQEVPTACDCNRVVRPRRNAIHTVPDHGRDERGNVALRQVTETKHAEVVAAHGVQNTVIGNDK